MTITSKFHLVNAIIGPTLIVLVLSTLSYLIAFLSFLDVNNGKVDSIFKTPIYGSVLLFALVMALTHNYLKTCKKIQLNNQGINLRNLFSSEFISWNEIKKIELIGKSRNRMIISETTNLDLKSGREIDIIAPYYQNIGPLRKSLEQVAESLENEKPIEISPATERPIAATIEYPDLNRMSKFSGNHLLSLNGASIYGWIAFSVYWGFKTYQDFSFGLTLLSLTLILGVFYGLFGNQLHYFYLDKNYLVIKNHVWPWVNHTYNIEDLKEVVVELPYRKSTSLRVITKNYQSSLYGGGSLRKSTWNVLMKEFSDLNVHVRNEAIS